MKEKFNCNRALLTEMSDFLVLDICNAHQGCKDSNCTTVFGTLAIYSTGSAEFLAASSLIGSIL
jgi:hypothetical protein